MKRILAVTIAALAATACSDSGPLAPVNPIAPSAPDPNVVIGGTVFVSNSNNAGFGSFRQAIADANANAAIRNVEFLPRVTTIFITSPVVFTGSQDLTIDGNIATINAINAGGTAFTTTGGGDLTVKSLTVRNAAGEGIFVDVPNPHAGTVKVTLVNVNIIDNLGHGVLINDQDDPSTTDDVQPGAGGSAASLDVTVIGSAFLRNGFSVSDRDGLRVNEGGDGDLTFASSLSRAVGNGADGYELDERGPGDVNLYVFATQFERNGPFDPADLDDGFDIDEYNDGSIVGRVVASHAKWNHEEGFDFNENNAGDLRVDFTLVESSYNGEEGIDLEEDDDFGEADDPNGGGGDLVTVMSHVKTFGNGAGADGGLKIREKEAGNLSATLSHVHSSDNFGSGIHVREGQSGSSTVSVTHAITTGNKFFTDGADTFLGHGIEFRGGGTFAITTAFSGGNAGFGVASETAATLTSVAFGGGNGLGNISPGCRRL